MSEQYSNHPGALLAGAIASASRPVTFSVDTAAGLPASGNFHVRIEDEILSVTSISGTSLTGSNVEGTAAVTHANGVAVTHILTAGSLDAIRADMSSSGVYASLPSSAKQGDRYLCTDSPYQLSYNGSAWDAFLSPFGKVTLPNTSGFSWVNQGTSTISTATGALIMTPQLTSGWNTRAYVKTAPATPYTFRIGFTVTMRATTRLGICLRNSSTSALVLYELMCNSNLSYTFNSSNLNSETSPNGSNWGTVGSAPIYGVVWMGIYDDGTNRHFQFSPDGQRWEDITSQSRTNFTTPNQVGIFANLDSSLAPQWQILSMV